MDMIAFKTTAAVLSAILCGIGLVSVGAQGPDEPRPGSKARPSRERPVRPAPGSAARPTAGEPTPPSRFAPSGTPPTPFAGPPGLSAEAIRSFTEIPPGGPQASGPVEGVPSPVGEPELPPSRQEAPTEMQRRPEYVVEPPDLLLVEVLEALPGRPISGERLVRPDGRISLGFYGDLHVAGLTLPQIKERIVLHLRRFIGDENLGLVEIDEGAGRSRKNQDGRVQLKDPRETDRVFVDVTAYNSQANCVEGEAVSPGRFPYTGGDTVLDLIHRAGGLLPTADRGRIRLVRSFPKGSPARVLPVDYEEVAMGTDSSTNYPIWPNDRLVIPGLTSSSDQRGEWQSGAVPGRAGAARGQSVTQPARPHLDGMATLYFDRRLGRPGSTTNVELEQRIAELEKKLDRLIGLVISTQPQPGGAPGAIPDDSPVARTPRRDPESGPATGRMESPPGRRIGEGSRSPGPQPPGPRRAGPAGPGPAGPRSPRLDGSRRDPDRPARPLPPADLPESGESSLDASPPR